MARYHFPAPKSGTPAKPGAQAGKSLSDPWPTMLESNYPRILENITMMWGFQELNPFLSKLIIDERGGRQGFPPEAWDEINTLAALHLMIVPSDKLF
jgi:hypothetical protein